MLGIPLLWIFEKVFSGLSESHVHVFVADVVKSFDTVDRGIFGFRSWSVGSSCLVSSALSLGFS